MPTTPHNINLTHEEEKLALDLSSIGFSAQVGRAADNGAMLIVRSPNESPKYAVSISLRDGRAFIQCRTGLYMLLCGTSVLNAVQQLVAVIRERDLTVDDTRTIGMEKYDYQRWVNDGEMRLIEREEGLGWKRLSEQQCYAMWSAFQSMGMCVPRKIRSSAFSVKTAVEAFNSSPAEASRSHLASWRTILSMFESCGEEGAPCYILSHNHEGYEIVPAEQLTRSIPPLLPFLPLDENILVCDRAVQFGVMAAFGTMTIEVFGEQSISYFSSHALSVLDSSSYASVGVNVSQQVDKADS